MGGGGIVLQAHENDLHENDRHENGEKHQEIFYEPSFTHIRRIHRCGDAAAERHPFVCPANDAYESIYTGYFNQPYKQPYKSDIAGPDGDSWSNHTHDSWYDYAWHQSGIDNHRSQHADDHHSGVYQGHDHGHYNRSDE